MKKATKRSKIQIAAFAVMVVVMAAALTACDIFGDDRSEDEEVPSEFIIQYSDDTGVHQITVGAGEPYSISRIPLKTGYDFLGYTIGSRVVRNT